MQLGTATSKGGTPGRVEVFLTTTAATAMETTNSPNPKMTKRKRRMDSILLSAGSVTKHGIHKSSADHKKPRKTVDM